MRRLLVLFDDLSGSPDVATYGNVWYFNSTETRIDPRQYHHVSATKTATAPKQ